MTSKPDEHDQMVLPFPLAEVENRIVHCQGEIVRTSDQRTDLLRATSVTHEGVEAALLSTAVRSRLWKILGAYLTEQSFPILKATVDAALKGESWAVKLVLELAGIPHELRLALAPQPQEDTETIISTDTERRILENIRRLLLQRRADPSLDDGAQVGEG